MTLLIGTSEGVWADRRVTGCDGALYRPSRKVVRGEEIVAAFCGSDAACCRAMAAVRAGEADPTALAAVSDGIVVTDAGRYELASGVATRIPARIPLAMGGSGYAEAQAYLYGAGRYTDTHIRAAFRYVFRVRTDCGDGVDALALRRSR
jgi:hypothetical protein